MTQEEELQALREENAALKAQVAELLPLKEQVEQLKDQVKQLTSRLAKDSHNSHLPPSSDRFVRQKKARSLRKSSGKKPGGQPDHPGETIQWCRCPEEARNIPEMQRAGTLLEPVEQQSKEALIQADVLHQDESSLYVAGQRWWTHVSATQTLTHYAVHPKRGKEALDAIGILPQFRGRSLHDGFRSYWLYECLHALCNVHHLRELLFVYEEQQQEWAKQISELLL